MLDHVKYIPVLLSTVVEAATWTQNTHYEISNWIVKYCNCWNNRYIHLWCWCSEITKYHLSIITVPVWFTNCDCCHCSGLGEDFNGPPLSFAAIHDTFVHNRWENIVVSATASPNVVPLNTLVVVAYVVIYSKMK